LKRTNETKKEKGLRNNWEQGQDERDYAPDGVQRGGER
jgi:hypothetical protein